MNTRIITERFGSPAFRAELPAPPHNTTAQFARRATGALRFRDRWRFAPRSVVIAIVAIACLLAGLLSNNTILVLVGCLGLPFALYYLLRLAPSQLETQATQAESDCDRLVSQFQVECQMSAKKFVAAACAAIQRESQSAVAGGSALGAIAEFKNGVKAAFLTNEDEATRELATNQANVTARRENLQRKRAAFASACRQTRAKLIPGPARRAAREVIDSVANLAQATLAEAAAKAEVQAFHEIVERMDEVPQISNQVARLDATADFQLPVWLGTPLPSREVLEAEARKLVDANIKSIRASLVQNGNTAAADEIIQAEIDRLFSGALPGPTTIEDCISALNGDARTWAKGVLNEASPLASMETFPDKVHHKKVFLMAAGASESSAYRSLQAAVPEQWTEVVAQNHPANELLCVIAEECTSYAEYPEIVNLLNELRALPKDEFEALATVCDPRVLREFFPELPEDHTRPTRLLASARVFDAIQRTGSEDYLLEGQIIAKGYRAALEALTLEPSVAADVAAKVECVVSGDGLSAALAKLVAAKSSPLSFVPKEFVKMFKAGVDEAIDEIGRRNIPSAQ